MVTVHHEVSSFDIAECKKCIVEFIGTTAIHNKCVRDAYRWTNNLASDAKVNRSELDFFRGIRALKPGPETICGLRKLEEVIHGDSQWVGRVFDPCNAKCENKLHNLRGTEGKTLYHLEKPEDWRTRDEKRNFENCSGQVMTEVEKAATDFKTINDILEGKSEALKAVWTTGACGKQSSIPIATLLGMVYSQTRGVKDFL